MSPEPETARCWFVYLAQCGDGTLYAGITTDLAARLHAHNAGKGAAYTRGRGPVALVYHESFPDRSSALKREAMIKRMSRAEKLGLRNPDTM
jgi:putative endonuclease